MFRWFMLLACCVYAVWATRQAGINVVSDDNGNEYTFERTERKTGGTEMNVNDAKGVNVLRVVNVDGMHIEMPKDRKVCIIRDLRNETEDAKCFEEIAYTAKVSDEVRTLCDGMEIIEARSLKDCKEDPAEKNAIASVADAKHPWSWCCRWRRYPAWPCWWGYNGYYGKLPLYCPVRWSWRWIWVRHCVRGYTNPWWLPSLSSSEFESTLIKE